MSRLGVLADDDGAEGARGLPVARIVDEGPAAPVARSLRHNAAARAGAARAVAPTGDTIAVVYAEGAYGSGRGGEGPRMAASIATGTAPEVTIVGGGLAGSEAAWQLAQRGVRVRIVEMRPKRPTPVHRTGELAELVCSNSLKSRRPDTAAGLLKRELCTLGSFVLGVALTCAVPAGGALAVDRVRFSREVTRRLEAHPLVTVERREATAIPAGRCIVAVGPLASEAVASAISDLVGPSSLAFYDAAAPIVEADSLDRARLFAQSRYDKGDADYLNAPLDREQYERLVAMLVDAERVIPRDFERRELFSACQPVEEVARSGVDALRYGALKPVGLTDPATGRRPWAVVQLRAENAEGSAYNLVGFQTNLTWPEQRRVFRAIPGLEHAEFSRYGVMHRNTFIDCPHVLDRTLAVPSRREVRFAGQVCGTEGYCEAIGSGLYAALCTYADLAGVPAPSLPATTALGSLLAWSCDPSTSDYQPMHVNFGIFPALDRPPRGKRDRHAAYAKRALDDLASWKASRDDLRLLPFEGDAEALDG